MWRWAENHAVPYGVEHDELMIRGCRDGDGGTHLVGVADWASARPVATAQRGSVQCGVRSPHWGLGGVSRIWMRAGRACPAAHDFWFSNAGMGQ